MNNKMNQKTIYISTTLLAIGIFVANFEFLHAIDDQKSEPSVPTSIAASQIASSQGPVITPSQQTNTLTTTSSSGTSTTAKDEIYIDDDNTEGSGDRRGSVHGDLEKDDEDDYSGSGYGDDDEDTRHSVNRNTPFSKLHSASESDHGSSSNNKEISGSGDGSTYDQDNDDSDDDNSDDLWTDTSTPESPQPEKPYIKEEHIPDQYKPIGETDDNDLKIGEDDRSIPKHIDSDHNTHYKETDVIMNKNDDRTTSFFAQPGILAGMYIAVIGGAVVGLLCAILVVMFIVYRMRKKDEGSYALDEPKRSPTANTYAKNTHNREFYA
jgi:syndecan 2